MTAGRAVTITRHGGPEMLEVVAGPGPEPGPGAVRVAVEAAACCYTDVLIRRNLYPDVRDRPPFVIGYDYVGRVDAVGPGVADRSPGDRVCDLCVTGGAASHVVTRPERLTPVPEGLDAAEAEVMVLSYLTAYQALARTGRVAAGDPVLVMGASGAVGSAALDVARAMGLRATGVASAARSDVVEGFGADALAYDAADYAQRLEAAAREASGFAAIVDGAGAVGPRRLARLARRGGAVVVLGFAARLPRPGTRARMRELAQVVGSVAGTVMADALSPGRRVAFYSITGMRKRQPDWYRADLGRLFAWLEAGRLTPIVAARYPFAEAVAAHRHLEAGGFAGRLVLTAD